MSKNKYHQTKKNTSHNSKITQPLITQDQSKSKLTLWFGFFAFTIAFMLYANTFQHSWVLDDYGVFKDNIFVTKGTDGYGDILTKTYRHGSGHYTDNLYRPVSQLMFATEWEISPDNPGFSHFINVLFYALNALLLFIVLKKLFKNLTFWIPFAITLLYIAHPIHTEVVANIKSRDEIVSLFFILISILLILKTVGVLQIVSKLKYYLLLFITFTLAMFTKESAITMLAAVPLLLFFFTAAKWKEYLPVIFIMGMGSLIYFITKSSVLDNSLHSGAFSVSIVDNYFFDSDLFTGLATAIMLMGKYLLLLFIPHPLACDYSYSQLPLVTFSNIWTILSLMTYIALLIYVIINFKKRDPIVFGILFFIITMSPTSNILIRFGSSFGERFLFLPSLGFCIALVFIIVKLLKMDSTTLLKVEKSKKNLFFGFIGIVFILFSVKTVSRAAEWKDQLTLFAKDVQTSSQSAHMRLYYGLALRDEAKKYDELNLRETNLMKYQKNNDLYIKGNFKAIEQLKKAVQIYPKYATGFEQLGLLYERTGKKLNQPQMVDSAELYYLQSLKYVPTTASVNSNLAKIYFERGAVEKARDYYLKAIKYDPIFADGYYNLGSTYGMLSKYDSSFYYFRKSLEFDKNKTAAYYFMGLNYTKINKFDSAHVMFDKAIQVDPKDVVSYSLKAQTFMQTKNYSEALAQLQKGISMNSLHTDFYILRGQLYVIQKEYDKAHADFSRCIEINPNIKQPYVEKINLFQLQNQKDSMQKYIQRYNLIK
jgi:protein O-mannosyl-transferase